MEKSLKHSVLFFILFCVQCIAFALIVAGICGNAWWTMTKGSVKYEKGLLEKCETKTVNGTSTKNCNDNEDILGFSGDNKGTENYFVVFFSLFLFSHCSETYLESCQLFTIEMEVLDKICL